MEVAFSQNKSICGNCGARFYTHLGCEWGYKHNGKLMCTYKCMRQMQRADQEKRKQKQARKEARKTDAYTMMYNSLYSKTMYKCKNCGRKTKKGQVICKFCEGKEVGT